MAFLPLRRGRTGRFGLEGARTAKRFALVEKVYYRVSVQSSIFAGSPQASVAPPPTRVLGGGGATDLAITPFYSRRRERFFLHLRYFLLIWRLLP